MWSGIDNNNSSNENYFDFFFVLLSRLVVTIIFAPFVLPLSPSFPLHGGQRKQSDPSPQVSPLSLSAIFTYIF